VEQELNELVDVGIYLLKIQLLHRRNSLRLEVGYQDIKWVLVLNKLTQDGLRFLAEKDALLCLAESLVQLIKSLSSPIREASITLHFVLVKYFLERPDGGSSKPVVLLFGGNQGNHLGVLVRFLVHFNFKFGTDFEDVLVFFFLNTADASIELP
jgi:hypothetical protein